MKRMDCNELDTIYSTYEQCRQNVITDFDQCYMWYFELGLQFPKSIYTIFFDDDFGYVLCSEYYYPE